MPTLAKMVKQGEANAVSWSEYTESEEEKNVYKATELRKV
jgi:hypothetical protein